MLVINILLFYLLIINSTSIIDRDFFSDDRSKCLKKHSNIEACINTSSTLEYKEEYGSQCCKLTFTKDVIVNFKKKFGENYKEVLMQFFNANKTQIEEYLKLIISDVKEETRCDLLPKKYQNTFLYDFSFEALNGTIKYDCGDGVKTFIVKNYCPITEDERVHKDFVDCGKETEEKKCYKAASKLSSQNSQCCWCQRIPFNSQYHFRDPYECKGYSINEIEQEMNTYTQINAIQYRQNFTLSCNCLNKKGKLIKSSSNSITGQTTIE